MGEDEGVASADLEEAQGQAPALLVLCEPSQDGMLLEEMDRLVKGERPERQNDGAAGAGDACEPVAAGEGEAGAGLRQAVGEKDEQPVPLRVRGPVAAPSSDLLETGLEVVEHQQNCLIP